METTGMGRLRGVGLGMALALSLLAPPAAADVKQVSLGVKGVT